jgi:hypothetical protein
MQGQRTQPPGERVGGPRRESPSAQLGPRAGAKPAPAEHAESPRRRRALGTGGIPPAGWHERAGNGGSPPAERIAVCAAAPARARRSPVRAGLSRRLVGLPGDSPRPDEQGRRTALTGRAATLASSAAPCVFLRPYPRRCPAVLPPTRGCAFLRPQGGFWLLRATERGESPAQPAGDSPRSRWSGPLARAGLLLPAVEEKRPANPMRPALHGRAARVHGVALGSDPDRSSARPAAASRALPGVRA